MPDLVAGDFLLLEEVMGPKTGAKADADPTHRQVVQLEDVRQMPAGDPAYRNMLTQDGDLQVFRNGDTPPLLRVTWRRGCPPVSAMPFRAHSRQGPVAQRLGGTRQHRPGRSRPHDRGTVRAGDAGPCGQDIRFRLSKAP